MWIIDFGCDMPMKEAASFEAPFERVSRTVRPEREHNRRASYAERWWIHVEPRPAMRQAFAPMPRYLATAMVAKHRLFAWLGKEILPDHQIIVFARSDDYFLGVLHSSVHELWALRRGTQLEDRPRYTPTTCFETFPLPWPPGQEPADDPLWQEISAAAKDLSDQRERWLNPPEWIVPIAATVDAAEDLSDIPAEARPLVRQSIIMAATAKDPRLKVRTLTNLYNERPTWLQLAHERLDRAVLAAYAQVDPAGGWSPDWAEVWKDTGAGFPLPAGHTLAVRRAEVDQQVLANLLRLNADRASTGDRTQ
jgi:hypothetical protein